MELTLRLYKWAPNRPGNTHYLHADNNVFMSEIQGNAIAELSDDNYRFEQGGVVISEGATKDWERASYAVVSEGDANGFFRCYFVDSAEARGGKVYLSLTLDNWGTYIAVAKIKDIYVNRSNMHWGAIPKYDDIQAVKNTGVSDWIPTKDALKSTDLSMVLLVALSTYSGTIAGTAQNVSTTRLLAFSPKSLSQAKAGDYEDLLNAFANAGTLYQWKTGTGLFESWNDAKCLRAWVVPTAWINVASFGTGDATFGFRSPNASSEISVRIGDSGGEVMPSVYDGTESLGIADDELIKNRVVFGTRAKQVEMPRTWQSAEVKYRVYADASSIKVCILTDGEEQDVSEAFEATLTSDENMYTNSQQVVKAFNFLANSFFGAFKAYKKSGEFGAFSSLVSSWGGGIETAMEVTAQSRNGGGDAVTTYIDYAKDGVGFKINSFYPWGFYLQASGADEIEKAKMDGATYNTYYGADRSLSDLAIEHYLVEEEGQDVFLKGSCKVSGAPSQACDAIEAEIARGLYYVDIGG